MRDKTIEVVLKANSAGFAAEMATAGGAVKSFGDRLGDMETRFNRVGSQLGGAGRTLTAAISLPLVAIGAISIKAASDFESSFAGVRKTVDATEAEFGQLSQAFRDMAKEIPINVNELNAIGEAAGALGIKKSAILDFTEVVAKMGVTTDLTSDQAANAFARIANIMGTSQGDFERMGSTIVALGNSGASTESEIVQMALRIAGAGKTVGLAETDVLGFASALSSVGIEAEAGGSAISKVMVDIASQVATGGDKLAIFAQVSGMTVKQFSAAWKDDAAGALISFIEGLGRMQAEGKNVFGVLDELELSEIRVRDALLRAAGAGDLFSTSLKTGSEAWRENSALNEEASKRFETIASKFQLLKNQALDVAISLGTALMPVAERLMNFIGDVGVPAIEKLVSTFSALPGPVQTAIIAGAGLLAVIGPLLIAAGLLASGIGSLIPVAGMLAKGMVSLMWAVSANPVVLLVAALATLAAGLIYAYKNSETFRNGVNALASGLKEGIGQAVETVINLVQAMGNRLINTLQMITTVGAAAFGWVPGVGDKLRGAKDAVNELDAGWNRGMNSMGESVNTWSNRVIGATDSAKAKLGELDGIQAKPKVGLEPGEFDVKVSQSTGALNKLGTSQARPILGAQDEEVQRKIASANSSLSAVGARTATPTINANPNGLNSSVNQAHGALSNIGGRTVSPRIDTQSNTESKVSSAFRSLQSIAGKVVTTFIDTVRRFVNEDGGYYPAVMSFAGGTEDHRAQIAPAGAMRLWAEPETGGEAYIPLAQSKRAGSALILQQVASDFGFQLIPTGTQTFQRGGLAGTPPDMLRMVGVAVRQAQSDWRRDYLEGSRRASGYGSTLDQAEFAKQIGAAVRELTVAFKGAGQSRNLTIENLHLKGIFDFTNRDLATRQVTVALSEALRSLDVGAK